MTAASVKEFHGLETGASIFIDAGQVASYRPTYTFPGTTVSMLDGQQHELREKFREFHEWVTPNWPELRARKPVQPEDGAQPTAPAPYAKRRRNR